MDQNKITVGKVMEEMEKDQATGKIIVFYEKGKIKGLELDRKIVIHIEVLDTKVPSMLV